VPAGKRLVIEQVSLRAGLLITSSTPPLTEQLDCTVTTTANGQTADLFFALKPVRRMVNEDTVITNQQVTAYADAGTVISMGCSMAPSGGIRSYSGTVSIVGYFVKQ
jgi:hypothetical protein